jgi:hypothetical protein
MGIKPIAEKQPAARALEAARAFFEPQLESIGLSAEQIEGQTLEELEVSLTNVNVAIQHPESFGLMSVSFAVNAGKLTALIVPSEGQGHMSIGALPVLLERKSMILRRIAVLRPQAQLSDLEKIVVNTIEDPQERESLLKSIETSKEVAVVQARSLQLQAEQTDQERERSMRLQFELKERTSALRRSWFERESVASKHSELNGSTGGCLRRQAAGGRTKLRSRGCRPRLRTVSVRRAQLGTPRRRTRCPRRRSSR